MASASNTVVKHSLNVFHQIRNLEYYEVLKRVLIQNVFVSNTAVLPILKAAWFRIVHCTDRRAASVGVRINIAIHNEHLGSPPAAAQPPY